MLNLIVVYSVSWEPLGVLQGVFKGLVWHCPEH
jgi:hypothetical protein